MPSASLPADAAGSDLSGGTMASASAPADATGSDLSGGTMASASAPADAAGSDSVARTMPSASAPAGAGDQPAGVGAAQQSGRRDVAKRPRLPGGIRGAAGGVLFWGLLAGVFAAQLAIVAKSLPLLAPDSLHYYARALVYAGVDRAEAFAAANAAGAPWGWRIDTISQMFDWDLVAPRVVLPALAAPFAPWLGWRSLLVISIPAAAAVFGLIAWAVRRRFGAIPALATAILAIGCRDWFYFLVAGLTESLSALLFALALGAAWRYRLNRRAQAGRAQAGRAQAGRAQAGRAPGWGAGVGWLAAAVAASGLFAFTRQAALIPAGALAVAFVGEWVRTRRFRNSWLAPAAAIVGTSAACQLYQALRYPFDQGQQLMEQTGQDTIGAALAHMPGRLLTVLKWAIGAFAQHDPVMLLAGGLGALGLVLCWRRLEAHLALGAALGGLAYQAANGALQTALRYCEPGLFAYALLVGAVLARIALRWRRHRDGAKGWPEGSDHVQGDGGALAD
ncbi:MAG: hypothetical protein LBD90_03880 [Bifidobacteriaceae bacterium]|jgi:hypothetical protein|nr:hypothetical protein [Bifidobacteriaceae bacterium]